MIRLSAAMMVMTMVASCQDAHGVDSARDAAERNPSDGQAAIDGRAPSDGQAPSDAQAPHDGQAPSDAQAPSDGQAPSDAQAPHDAQSSEVGRVPYDPSCGNLETSSNDQGVGASCRSARREFACPLTKTCFADLVDPKDEPVSFCTKSCSTDDDCGEQAHCCQPPNAAKKYCVLDSCTALCD
jgi:hypothetical protein